MPDDMPTAITIAARACRVSQKEYFRLRSRARKARAGITPTMLENALQVARGHERTLDSLLDQESQGRPLFTGKDTPHA